LIENGDVTHTFESDPTKDHFRSSFWGEDFTL